MARVGCPIPLGEPKTSCRWLFEFALWPLWQVLTSSNTKQKTTQGGFLGWCSTILSLALYVAREALELSEI